MELGREPDEPMKCKVCGAATLLYRCNYCGGLFCVKHHLPPNHDCPNLHLWKAKAPPGLTIRFEGRRYASVDVPVASEPRAPAAAEHAGYDSQLGTAKLHDRILEELERPYARKWRRVPVEGGEGGKALEGRQALPDIPGHVHPFARRAIQRSRGLHAPLLPSHHSLAGRHHRNPPVSSVATRAAVAQPARAR